MNKCRKITKNCLTREYNDIKNNSILCSELIDKVEAIISTTNDANCEQKSIFEYDTDPSITDFSVKSHNHELLFECKNNVTLHDWLNFLCEKIRTCRENGYFNKIFDLKNEIKVEHSNINISYDEYRCTDSEIKERSFYFEKKLTKAAKLYYQEYYGSLQKDPINEINQNIENQETPQNNVTLNFNNNYDLTEGTSGYLIFYFNIFIFIVLGVVFAVFLYKYKRKRNNNLHSVI